jgi:hypothetical protein
MQNSAKSFAACPLPPITSHQFENQIIAGARVAGLNQPTTLK